MNDFDKNKIFVSFVLVGVILTRIKKIVFSVFFNLDCTFMSGVRAPNPGDRIVKNKRAEFIYQILPSHSFSMKIGDKLEYVDGSLSVIV